MALVDNMVKTNLKRDNDDNCNDNCNVNDNNDGGQRIRMQFEGKFRPLARNDNEQ